VARTFVKNTANYMDLGANSIGSRVNGAAVINLHARVIFDAIETVGADGDDIFNFPINNSLAGIAVRGRVGSANVLRLTGRSSTADTLQGGSGGTTLQNGVQYSIGAVWNISGDKIQGYLNGALDFDGTVSFGAATYATGTPTTWRDSIGSLFNTGTTAPSDSSRQVAGGICDFAVWRGSSLTAFGLAEWGALADGFTPDQIRPDLLIGHMPIMGRTSPEPDRMGGLTGTITGTLAYRDNPRLITPPRRQVVTKAVAAAVPKVGAGLLLGGRLNRHRRVA
jgi:hypothetical protein